MSPFSLDSDSFNVFRRMIRDRSGIWLGDEKKNFLQVRIEERLRALKLSTSQQYYHYLKFDVQRIQELDLLLEAIFINETWFFREIELLQTWIRQVLPELAKPNHQVKLWSAACSTGEEPYTLAMLLLESIPQAAPPLFDILATDMSRKAIATSQAGIYSAHSLRHTDPYWKFKYFAPVGETQWTVQEPVRRLVRFAQMNLMGALPAFYLEVMDVILCRNVLIYFDQESRQTALRNLHSALKPGGYLLFGYSETLSFDTTLFEMVTNEGLIMYRKPRRLTF